MLSRCGSADREKTSAKLMPRILNSSLAGQTSACGKEPGQAPSLPGGCYTFCVRRLIVNADDLGLTAGVNRAIVETDLGGFVSSATLMANGPAFEDALTAARLAPNLSVGCHVVLVDGTPVSPPETADTLLAIRSAEP